MATQAAGVVTPEAVPLDFEAAGLGSRFVARLIDLVLQTVAALVLLGAGALVAAQAGPSLPPAVAFTLIALAFFGITWVYPTAFETLRRGRTPGKSVMRLRVVTVEGAPVRFRHAAIRATLGLIDYGLIGPLPAVVAMLATQRNQRLGDLVAGTVVLRERTGLGAATAARFAVPDGAESYAATIDTAGLRPADYATVRSFLLRAGQMSPQTRADVARQVARPLASRLHHTPPDGVDAELFLACVAARYQQRSPGAGAAGDAGASADTPRAAPPPAPDGGGFAPPR